MAPRRATGGERTVREWWPVGHGDTLLTVRIGRVKSAGLSRDRARTGSEPRGTVRAQHRSQNCRLEGQVWGGGDVRGTRPVHADELADNAALFKTIRRTCLTQAPSVAPRCRRHGAVPPPRRGAGFARSTLVLAPHAITPTVAVTRPEHSIDHCRWLTQQPGYIA